MKKSAIQIFKIGISLLLLLSAHVGVAQDLFFNRQDSLRGSIGEGREKWDVLHYDIRLETDIENQSIRGVNTMRFWDEGVKKMQIDLQEPMRLDSAIYNNKALALRREGNVYWVYVRDTAAQYKIKPGEAEIQFYFSGKPRVAQSPPWDGGWIWKKDEAGNPWISVACQGDGASLWLPCKDSQADEPDRGSILRLRVPDSLVAVGHGRLISTTTINEVQKEYVWEVVNPINNYNIIPYIGKYVHFGEKYAGEKGNLDVDYWVLENHLEKAKKQFSEVPRMLKAFEYWFGPYPFYEDGFKLVEAPHLGMEHQSAIAYGNKFQNGYLGMDRSGTGIGKLWDFIIVHESGHEWFGNNITTKDVADMWVHEGFTNYSETLFTEYYYGKEAAKKYIIGIRKNIQNKKPIIGRYGVQQEGSGDMYDKGGNMIHFIRMVMANDKKFRNMLRSMNEKFYHKTVTGKDIETFISEYAKIDFSKLFDQYLRSTKIPVLEYKIEPNRIAYRWNNVVEGFSMPIEVSLHADSTKPICIQPETEWKYLNTPDGYDGKTWIVNEGYYVENYEL